MSVLIDKILIDLRIIAKLPESGRISTTTKDPITVELNNNYQGIKRWLWGDSRELTYKALKNLVDNIIDISDNIMQSKFMNLDSAKENSHHEYTEHKRCFEQLRTLANEIDNSLKGFGNLHATYKDDPTIASKLEVLITKLDGQKNKIKSGLDIQT